MMPTTRDRVPIHTDDHVNALIQRHIEESVQYHAANPARIDARVRALDAEWDIERAIEANASALAFTGVALGGLVSKRWLTLSALVTGFLFQHALQGWCPPSADPGGAWDFLHDLRDRSGRHALKALRGDFAQASARRRNARDRTRPVLSRAVARLSLRRQRTPELALRALIKFL